MSDSLKIKSHKGPYSVHFDKDAILGLNARVHDNVHFIVDRRVAELYQGEMPAVLSAPSVIFIDATETNKSLDKFSTYVEHLVQNQVRRDQELIAIGGGIIQDISCFLAATLLRGITWNFYPTTLLAQADSCIGSKSSINSGTKKNILGTFTPPKEIYLDSAFLNTLDELEMRSGVGEMLKVHAIDGVESFNQIATDYDNLFSNRTTLIGYVRRALAIKKYYIELDEFDQGPRRIFNYGHTFGHAIEAATNFTVPHGIAVSMGMDMANWFAWKLEVGSEDNYRRMHAPLAANYSGFEKVPIPITSFLAAISRDKKNVGTKLTLILPDSNGKIFSGSYPNDARFHTLCAEYFGGNL